MFSTRCPATVSSTRGQKRRAVRVLSGKLRSKITRNSQHKTMLYWLTS